MTPVGTAVLAAAALFILGVAAMDDRAMAASPKPQRIVSLNVCTDQLLLSLADRARIASLTFLAADPSSSAMAAEAKGLATNRGRAEEILPLRPDLVLAGDTAARTTVQLLQRLGHRVVVVPLARTLADIPRNIGAVARAIGEDTRGARLATRFRRDLGRITAQAGVAPRPTAILFGPSGVSSGGDSLAGAVIEAAGWANGARGIGLAGVGRISLETVLGLRPQLLILSTLKKEYPSLANGLLRHPALARRLKGRTVIRIHHHRWACGTPHVLGAIRRLARLRDRLTGGEQRVKP